MSYFFKWVVFCCFLAVTCFGQSESDWRLWTILGVKVQTHKKSINCKFLYSRQVKHSPDDLENYLKINGMFNFRPKVVDTFVKKVDSCAKGASFICLTLWVKVLFVI